ncbi:MAG: hypothetical protein K9I02_05340 [Haliscomenobacter sp.]|nr:hypothetical protein [Haliscomenobacter sp.]
MKTIYLFIFLLGFSIKCVGQSKPEIPKAKLLQTLSKYEPTELQNDSLGIFRQSLYSFILPYIEQGQGKSFKQFSICIKTNALGEIDTFFVSHNASSKLKYQLSKFQDKIDCTELIKRAKSLKWFNTYIIFPVIILYENSEAQNFQDLVDYRRGDLQFSFSFNSLNFSEQAKSIVIGNPIGGVFGKKIR